MSPVSPGRAYLYNLTREIESHSLKMFLLSLVARSFVCHLNKRTWCYLWATHLPHCAIRKARLYIWCTACGSLLWDPGLYIRPLCVCASFHSTSERFPQYKELLFSSSPVTAKTTVWFLDGVLWGLVDTQGARWEVVQISLQNSTAMVQWNKRVLSQILWDVEVCSTGLLGIRYRRKWKTMRIYDTYDKYSMRKLF